MLHLHNPSFKRPRQWRGPTRQASPNVEGRAAERSEPTEQGRAHPATPQGKSPRHVAEGICAEALGRLCGATFLVLTQGMRVDKQHDRVEPNIILSRRTAGDDGIAKQASSKGSRLGV